MTKRNARQVANDLEEKLIPLALEHGGHELFELETLRWLPCDIVKDLEKFRVDSGKYSWGGKPPPTTASPWDQCSGLLSWLICCCRTKGGYHEIQHHEIQQLEGIFQPQATGGLWFPLHNR